MSTWNSGCASPGQNWGVKWPLIDHPVCAQHPERGSSRAQARRSSGGRRSRRCLTWPSWPGRSKPPPAPSTQGGHPCKPSRFSFNRKPMSSALHVLQSDLHGGEEGPGGKNPLNGEAARGPLGLRASAVGKEEVSVANPPLPGCEDTGLTGLEGGSPQSGWLSERRSSDPGRGPARRKYLE